MEKTQTGRKRSLFDKFITSANSARYTSTEPRKLKLARRRWVDEYNPLISVYIPTYNRPKLIFQRGIDSILRQTYRNLELIITDDGSDTVPIGEYEKLAKEMRLTVYCLSPRKRLPVPRDRWLLGPTRAANYALKRCSGKWIARNDDDDIWTPTHLEHLLRFAQVGNYEYVSASYIAERKGKRIVIRGSTHTSNKFENEGEKIMIGGIQSTLYRSYLKCFKFNKHCWRKQWNANNDIDLPVRLYKAGVRMGFLDKVVSYILPRPGEDEIGLEAVYAQMR